MVSGGTPMMLISIPTVYAGLHVVTTPPKYITDSITRGYSKQFGEQIKTKSPLRSPLCVILVAAHITALYNSLYVTLQPVGASIYMYKELTTKKRQQILRQWY